MVAGRTQQTGMGTMKTSGWWTLAIVAGALAVQGCASPGGTQSYAPASVQQAPVQAPPPQDTTAIPTNSDGKPVVRADTKENFDAVAAAIRQQMQPGGRWQYISKSERATIDSSFSDMSALYAQFGSVDKMDAASRARLLADQNTINTILTKKDGDRLICQSQIPVGSHLPVKTCKTYAQIQAEQKGAQEYLRRNAPTTQNTNAYGGH